MPQVLRFEVVNEDCIVDLLATNTLFDLMSIVCREWLNEVRDDDGGVYDHMWKIHTSSTTHVGPSSIGAADHDDWVAEEEESSTQLEELELRPGSVLRIEYDFGSTTYFNLILKSFENVSESEAARTTYPRRVESATDGAAALQPYVPPRDTPNLNDLFSNANELLFQSAAQWIVMFPRGGESSSCSVEAGPNAMGDMVYAPYKFGSIGELLVALDKAGLEKPDDWCREDAFSRFIFPKTLSGEDESKYREFKADNDEFERVCREKGVGDGPMSLSAMASAGLPQDYIFRLCGPKQVITRVTENDLSTKLGGVDLNAAFPKTAAAHDSDEIYWMSYRREKLMLCKGRDSGERGIPRPGGILAQANQRVASLHEFFCLAEALWTSVLQ